MYGRSFSTTEANWSAWERELYAYRESLAATDHLVKGFVVECYTDHRNNLFTGSQKGNKRINKKILRWSLDIEEYGERIKLRNPQELARATRKAPFPSGGKSGTGHSDSACCLMQSYLTQKGGHRSWAPFR